MNNEWTDGEKLTGEQEYHERSDTSLFLKRMKNESCQIKGVKGGNKKDTSRTGMTEEQDGCGWRRREE